MVFLLDPSGTRRARLVLGALRAAGYPDVEIVSELPESGTVVVFADAPEPVRSASAVWAAERPSDRLLVVDPPVTDAPVLRAGQRANAPSVAPARGPEPGDAYLADLVLIAFRGYMTRLAHRGAVPPRWVAYLAEAIALLERRAVEPAVIDHFRSSLLSGASQGDPGSDYLGRRVRGSRAPFPHWPNRDDDPKTPLLRAALRVAGEGDDDAWAEMLAHLDTRRGLFHYWRGAPANAYQHHPVLVCAIARRLEVFDPVAIDPILFPRPPAVGSLEHAGLLNDPPELAHSYDLSEYTVVPDLVADVLGPPPGPRPLTVAVRHDVDRRLTADDLARHLDLEGRLGLRSSWYFKSETFDPDLAERIRDAGNEVAYHADLLENGDDGFVARLASWLGRTPGMTFHGGLGADAFRGRRSLETVARLGLAYSELLIGVRAHPVLWPAEDRWLPLAPLPVKVDTFPERVRAHLDAVVRPGALVIVENHPDLLPDLYVETLERLAREGVEAATVADALEPLAPR